MFAGGFLIGFTNPSHYWDYPATAFLMLASIPLALAVTALRFINIGESGWLAALTLIPFIGFIVILICLIVPPGYRHHKQMDTVGGAMVAAFAALITTIVALAIFG